MKLKMKQTKTLLIRCMYTRVVQMQMYISKLYQNILYIDYTTIETNWTGKKQNIVQVFGEQFLWMNKCHSQ